jgi:hypothetical protein
MPAVAGYAGVSAVGTSIERLLNTAFAATQPIPGQTTRAVLIRTEDLDRTNGAQLNRPALSVLLYRVDFTKSMRSVLAHRAADDGLAYLPLDLHYLLTAWADNARDEHLIVGRALQVLERFGMLSGPALDSVGGFDAQEAVSVLMEDLTTDDLMRTFEALEVDFRLTLPYLARVVVVTGDDAAPAPRTVTVLSGITP